MKHLITHTKRLMHQSINDMTIEHAIVAAGKTAPRVTPMDIEANISSEWYFTAADGIVGNPDSPLGATPETYQPLDLLTFCVMVLHNGFTVTGESACASPENFNAEIGRTIARQNAVQKIWPLMGYQLKEQLYQMTLPDAEPA
jgi:Phage protein (N4 Gp49/phage Sf6 gene 66) family